MQHTNDRVADLISDTSCVCDDGSCDWCCTYYASDEGLAERIGVYVNDKVSAARAEALEDAVGALEAGKMKHDEKMPHCPCTGMGNAITILKTLAKGEDND